MKVRPICAAFALMMLLRIGPAISAASAQETILTLDQIVETAKRFAEENA